MYQRRTWCWTLSILAVLLAGSLSSCASGEEGSDGVSITDMTYLTDDRWNDGQAEVAFYRVERTENAYGDPAQQEFLVGTYLVKHTFDQAAMSKAGENPEEPVSSFKYAQFYELEHGSYQRKRSYVVNARQRDLQPLKQSYSSFDWCSNQYRELAFREGEVQWLSRSDDYGNARERFSYEPRAYPVAELPLLVRGLDFSNTNRYEFQVVHGQGVYTSAEVERAGTDTLATPAGQFATERLVVRYDDAVPSTIGETAAAEETYWRGTGPARLLVQLSAEGGRYRMQLIEVLRSPYWKEDIYERLQRITQRP